MDTDTKELEKDAVAVLCYVDRPFAYFTTQPLVEQWGDDWNDAPYEHNAGTPYYYHVTDAERGREPWEIIKVAYDAWLLTPDHNYHNSPYSVEQINAKCVPWLRTEDWEKEQVQIWAGTTIEEFTRLIRSVRGTVYTAEEAIL